MKGLFLSVLTCLILQEGVPQKIPCGEERMVSGVEGGEATLHVDPTGIRDITWVTLHNSEIIATSEPGKVKQTMYKAYTGRLNATGDGSLVIANLSREDQVIYTAYIKRQGAKWCTQEYRLTVHGVSAETSCGEERNVSGVEGGEVTLHVDPTGIRTITWVTLRTTEVIATTEPGKVTKDIAPHYKGRLTATSHGSLVITNLTRGDQGSYKANILRSSQCIQMYNLTVYDKRYTSPANGTACSHNSSSECPGSDRTPGADYRTINIIRLTLSACVLCLTCSIFIHHINNVVERPRNPLRRPETMELELKG